MIKTVTKPANARNNFKITNIIVISLPGNKFRLEHVKQAAPDVEVFDAVDTRTIYRASTVLEKYQYKLRPKAEHYVYYFSQGPGAVGCYFSHMFVWQRIVNNAYGRTLIIEDDVNTRDLSKLLNVNHSVNPGFFGNGCTNKDIIQLNKRTSSFDKFNGTECYMVTHAGAKKLYNECTADKYIRYPVDAYIGSKHDLLQYDVKPRVGLNDKFSDITGDKKMFWDMDNRELERLKRDRDYKWWF